MTPEPTISVLLPVYNAGEYLRVALDSVLSQTRSDMEVIVVDDGSRDHSAQIVRSYDDPRIQFSQQENHGLAWTLNRAAGLARGRYLARMDQDDVALPRRFELQAAYLDAHPRVFLLGTAAEIWEEDNPTGRHHRHPTDPLELAFAQLFDNHFVHSSVMFRREILDTVGGYSTEKSRQPEDFELWSRVARRHEIANLPEVLQVYREREGSMCRTGVNPYRDRVVNICSENLALACGVAQPDPAHRLAANLAHGVVSGRVSARALRETQAVVRLAAAGVAAHLGCSPNQLDASVAQCCNNLAHHAARRTLRGVIAAVARRLKRAVQVKEPT